MLLERTAQLKYLEEQYAKPGARMLVVYGLRNVGKTGLLKEFAKDKKLVFCAPDPVPERNKDFCGRRNVNCSMLQQEIFPPIRSFFRKFPNLPERKLSSLWTSSKTR